MSVILEILLLMFLFRDQVSALKKPLFEICYWLSAFVLLFILIVIALLDVREGLKTYATYKRNMLKDLIEGEPKK